MSSMTENLVTLSQYKVERFVSHSLWLAVNMTRLRYGILVFLAIFSILVSNLKADGENNSPQENLVKRHAEPGTEEDELFDDISAEDTKGKRLQIFDFFSAVHKQFRSQLADTHVKYTRNTYLRLP